MTQFLLTDFVCLYNYEFWLSLYKIVRSSVILLLPLFTHINDLSWLSSGTSIKSDGVKLVYSRFFSTAFLLFNKNNRKRKSHDFCTTIGQWSSIYCEYNLEKILSTSEVGPILALILLPVLYIKDTLRTNPYDKRGYFNFAI